MKYGVISVRSLLDDLLNWRTLYMSGRMHKPVRAFCRVCNATSEHSASLTLLITAVACGRSCVMFAA